MRTDTCEGKMSTSGVFSINLHINFEDLSHRTGSSLIQQEYLATRYPSVSVCLTLGLERCATVLSLFTWVTELGAYSGHSKQLNDLTTSPAWLLVLVLKPWENCGWNNELLA